MVDSARKSPEGSTLGRMHKKPMVYLALFVGSVLGAFLSHTVAPALASRNSSGTFSLPAGNPVVSGTTVTSVWANSTLTDIGTELTSSLDRNGRGAMLAALQIVNGTVAAPSLTFASDLDTGMYRTGANDGALAAGGVRSFGWTATTATLPLATTCSSTLAVTGAQTNAAGVTITQSVSNTGGATTTGNGSGPGITATGGTTGIGGIFSGGGSVGSGTGANGITVAATGTDKSAGVFTGSGTGWGSTFVGGSTGGGIAAAPGGSPTSDTNTRFAFEATAGHIKLSGGYPTSSTSFSNTLTAANIVKGFAIISPGGGSHTLNAGFNVSSIQDSSDCVRVNWNQDFAGTTYGCTVTPGDGLTAVMYYTVINAGTTDFCGYISTTGSSVDLNTGKITVTCYGAQ